MGQNRPDRGIQGKLVGRASLGLEMAVIVGHIPYSSLDVGEKAVQLSKKEADVSRPVPARAPGRPGGQGKPVRAALPVGLHFHAPAPAFDDMMEPVIVEEEIPLPGEAVSRLDGIVQAVFPENAVAFCPE